MTKLNYDCYEYLTIHLNDKTLCDFSLCNKDFYDMSWNLRLYRCRNKNDKKLHGLIYLEVMEEMKYYLMYKYLFLN